MRLQSGSQPPKPFPSLLAAALALSGCGAMDPIAAPPAPLKVETPRFLLQPGEELFKCYYTSLPSDMPVATARIESSMTPGSHHMILFYTDKPAAPDGTFGDCGREDLDSPQAVPLPFYLTQEPDDHLDLPKGVAMPLKARQPLIFQMHYFNASAAVLEVQVKLTIHPAVGEYEIAGPFASYQTEINIPAHGTQTVSGHCIVPTGSQFFSMSTHTHKNSINAAVRRWKEGQPTDMLVETKDWEHPTVHHWSAPFMILGETEEIHYSCTYRNDGDKPIKQGQSAATNEMCMAIGYYFPSPHATICINSKSFTF
ncbi:MAG: hypothetical protein EXR72_26310 [Myxococcales bacterium]|nr:hypothetical protein [Myxococcales bacterium]